MTENEVKYIGTMLRVRIWGHQWHTGLVMYSCWGSPIPWTERNQRLDLLHLLSSKLVQNSIFDKYRLTASVACLCAIATTEVSLSSLVCLCWTICSFHLASHNKHVIQRCEIGRTWHKMPFEIPPRRHEWVWIIEGPWHLLDLRR